MSYFGILFTQTALSSLDILGIGFILQVVINLQSENGVSDTAVISIPFVSKIVANTNSNYLLIVVVIFFILKGACSLILHLLNIRLMTRETKRVVRNLLGNIFSHRRNLHRKLTSQEISYMIYNSTEIIFKETLVPLVVIVAETTLILIIVVGLFFTVKLLVFPLLFYFLIIFLLLRHLERRLLQNAYVRQSRNEVLTRRLVQEVSFSLRELLVSSKLSYFIGTIERARSFGIDAGGRIAFSQLMPKYFYDMALFGGIGVIAASAIVAGNSDLVLSYLMVFVVASSRLIPSLLRIQYYLGVFQKSSDQSSRIFQVLTGDSLTKTQDTLGDITKSTQGFGPQRPEILLQDVRFKYDSADTANVVKDVSLTIPFGDVLAIVGPSGAGKSTLVDLILGFLSPQSGIIQIAEKDPEICFNLWPGLVSYVPQRVTIYDDSLLNNIAIGDASTTQDVEIRVVELLKKVGLGDFFKNLANGVETQMGELGSRLSGGQIQRLGIARALFCDPKIIIFDESTSSLDAKTELEVMEMLLSHRNNKTLIFVAHRLSTIKSADRILYFKNGRIAGLGDFDTLSMDVPEFSEQVKLLGFKD